MEKRKRINYDRVILVIGLACFFLIVLLRALGGNDLIMGVVVILFWTSVPAIFFIMGIDPETRILNRAKNERRTDADSTFRYWNMGTRIMLLVWTAYLLLAFSSPIYYDFFEYFVINNRHVITVIVDKDEALVGGAGLFARTITVRNRGMIEEYTLYFSPRERITLGACYVFRVFPHAQVVLTTSQCGSRRIAH